MKSEPAAKKVSLDRFIYGKYLERHNLAVIKTKWVEDKKTGLKTLHVWTKRITERKRDTSDKRI